MRLQARILSLLAWIVAAPTLGAAQSGHVTPVGSAGSASRLVVLELFTSQGCSSCPAADALLKNYAQRPDVMALSLAVDYWDHLGWKDTLASAKNTARQKHYAKTLGIGNVYTPQIVIAGAAHAVGSSKSDIEKAIALARNIPARMPLEMAASNDGKRVTIDIGAVGDRAAIPATVWLAVVAPRVEVEVKRGENRGRTLVYHNVVREIAPVGMWSGKTLKIELPASAVMEKSDRCAVLLQADDGGQILAAVWMTQ